MFIISFIVQAFAHSAAAKKGASIGLAGGMLLGIAYASSVEYHDRKELALRSEQTEKWAQHMRESDMILSNFSATLLELNKSVGRIDERTFYLYKRELEKTKNK